MKTLRLALGLSLLSLLGCASDVGSACTNEDDCGGSTICAHDALCGDLDNCVGVCSDPCDTDDDCSNEERCFTEPGGGRQYCRFESLGGD